jgi:hypothetical protein
MDVILSENYYCGNLTAFDDGQNFNNFWNF